MGSNEDKISNSILQQLRSQKWLGMQLRRYGKKLRGREGACLLGGLGAHVRVGQLLRHKHAGELAGGAVHLVHGELDGALSHLVNLVGLLEQLLLALRAVGLKANQGTGAGV